MATTSSFRTVFAGTASVICIADLKEGKEENRKRKGEKADSVPARCFLFSSTISFIYLRRARRGSRKEKRKKNHPSEGKREEKRKKGESAGFRSSLPLFPSEPNGEGGERATPLHAASSLILLSPIRKKKKGERKKDKGKGERLSSFIPLLLLFYFGGRDSNRGRGRTRLQCGLNCILRDLHPV